MRTRAMFAALTAVAMLATVAGPAGANVVGVFPDGVAMLGKNATFCNHDGTSDVSGPGLGMPAVNGVKELSYSVHVVVTVINDATKGVKAGVSTGDLHACGRMRWVGKQSDGTTVGAACGLSKGYAGKSRIVFTSGPKAAAGFPHNTYSLHGIGWKTSGPQIIFWGSGNQGSLAKGEQGSDLLTGTINAKGDVLPCVSKAGAGSSKAGGATQFPVFGEFQISTVPGPTRRTQDSARRSRRASARTPPTRCAPTTPRRTRHPSKGDRTRFAVRGIGAEADSCHAE